MERLQWNGFDGTILSVRALKFKGETVLANANEKNKGNN